MGYENNAINLATGSANNHYGPRDTEDGVVGGGSLPGEGAYHEAVFYVRDTDFTISSGAGLFNTEYTIPAGSIPVEAYFEVTEAFAQTGGTTSTTLHVGTSDGVEPPTEATITSNGFNTTDASTGIPTVKELDTSGDGTWGSALAADTPVAVAIVSGGGAITAVSAGRAKVVVRYIKV